MTPPKRGQVWENFTRGVIDIGLSALQRGEASIGNGSFGSARIVAERQLLDKNDAELRIP
jgi:hypothetical protein